MSERPNSIETRHLEDFVETDPVVERVVGAAGDMPVYLVGGSVRDLLIGRRPSELDFVVEGAVDGIARALDPDAVIHTEFGTAAGSVDGVPVDLVRTRSESYPEPGSLPEVEPGDLASDLARRDFTVNSMAIPVGRHGSLVDPFDGVTDLENGILKTLHDNSFVDDPTRALRAARYCSRLGLVPDASTLAGLGQVALSTVSNDRIDHEIELIALDEDPVMAMALLHEWGVMSVPPEALLYGPEAFRILEGGPWSEHCSKDELLRGLLSPAALESARSLEEEPADPWQAYGSVRSVEPAIAVIASAAGATWVDAWPSDWINLKLRISGEDLISSGIPQGQAIGVGLEAALRDRLLNGDRGAERELEVALEEARRNVSG